MKKVNDFEKLNIFWNLKHFYENAKNFWNSDFFDKTRTIFEISNSLKTIKK